jgi:predicted unusual protein kinase regulating ubiquinone biosynthesis (AarF/ABC1/UbiB family)
MASDRDEEANRLSGRLARYARVGTGVGGVAARMAGARLFGRDLGDARNAVELAAALGGLKGPLMKIAQLFSTIPDLLPPKYAAELGKLQAQAPPMGPAFVKRRMSAELGPHWEKRFRSFERSPSAAASLGQVHRAVGKDSKALACKLQYPDMSSAVEADLRQLGVVLGLQRRFSPEIDTTEIGKELGERVREELDYVREARHMALYAHILSDEPLVRVPEVVPTLSTARLLTMGWLDGRPLLDFVGHSLDERNLLARALFYAWWRPFVRYGVIHGDPHLGNYTVFEEAGRPAGVNLFDYGSIRIFPPTFVQGVLELYEGLKTDDRTRIAGAYRSWGFQSLGEDTVDTLNIWARFIYAPLLDDRVRTIADGVAPQAYGRREVWEVKQRLKPKEQLTIPREFVLMDRAAIGLGSVFLHLRAELNFHRLFEAELAGFSVDALARRQQQALKRAGLAAH